MLLPLPHSVIVWQMGGDQGLSSFGPNLDGLMPESPERKEAVRSDLKLQSKQRYRCRVEVRKDSLRAVLDDEEVLKWSGDLKRFGGGWNLLKDVADPNRLGLHTHRASLTFHKAELRPPGWARTLLPSRSRRTMLPPHPRRHPPTHASRSFKPASKPATRPTCESPTSPLLAR